MSEDSIDPENPQPKTPAENKSPQELFEDALGETLERTIRKELDKFSSQIPQQPSKKIKEATVQNVTTSVRSMALQYSSPIPPGFILQGYEDIKKGLAERVIKMAEDEADHRREMDKEAIWLESSAMKKQQATQRISTICGLVIGLAGIVGSTIMAINGAEKAAMTLGGGVLFGLVAVFVTGRTITSSNEQ